MKSRYYQRITGTQGVPSQWEKELNSSFTDVIKIVQLAIEDQDICDK